MKPRILPYLVFALAASVPSLPDAAQLTLRPAPPPIVTAENEPWYLAGEPITFSGSVYFPAGAQVFFNPYEMVRSGFYQGIPLYTKTTLEPYSVVFVPLAGSLMQPYERRRAGDVAGTVGSTAPSFPVDRTPDETAALLYQAAAPPMQVAPLTGTFPAEREEQAGRAFASTVSTAGANVPAPGPLRTARKPEGLNGFYIEYSGHRWFSSGPAVEFDANRFTRTGDYHGFAVYSAIDRADTSIYVAVTSDPHGLLAPYAERN